MYAPHVFDCDSLEAARAVILTAGGGLSTDERWEAETRWLMRRIGFEAGGLVIDYGCGIGRLAREITNPVLGVDISATMRAHAVEYVGKADFRAISPADFEAEVEAGLRADGAVAAWSLQHVLDLLREVGTLMRSLRPGAPFWLLDLGDRHVPADSGVMPDDGARVAHAIEPFCRLESEEALDIWRENPGNPGMLKLYRRV